MKKKILAVTMAMAGMMAFAGVAYAGSLAQRNTSDMITEERAKDIAIEHSKVNEEDVKYIFAKTDREHGMTVYEVEFFVSDGSEYDYEINAATGEIVGFDYDAEMHYSFDGRPREERRRDRDRLIAETSAADNNDIGADEAKKKALEDAGVSESEVRFIESERDRDDGRIKYEIKFFHGSLEYEYEVDGATGRITERDVESIYD